jgi:hypothetical protein
MAKLILIADDNDDDVVALRQTLKDAGVKNPMRRVDDADKGIAYLCQTNC